MKFVEKEISRPKEKKYLEKGNAFYRHAMHLSNGMMGGRTLDRQGQQVLGEDNCDVDIMCDSSTLEVNYLITVWKLRKFTFTLLWQKCREINIFY